MDYNFIPKWSNTNDQEELELFLASLQEAVRLRICESEQLLIFASLQKSDKIDIYTGLTPKEKSSIHEFATYIRKTYSSTPDEQRAELGTIRQKPNESPQQLIKRIEKKYFHCRGIEVPNTLEDHQKSDIRFHFINALDDPMIQRHLVLSHDVTYENLGLEARKITQLSKNLNRVYSINDSRTATDDLFAQSDSENSSSETSSYYEE